MKTISKIFLLLAMSMTIVVFNSYGSNNTATTDEGVEINGIIWATRNVDAPGTFAPYPESSGMLFQWNRKKGWNATDKEIEGWDNTNASGTAWYAENDPCPQGWRVPTLDELWSLDARDSEWIKKSGVYGHLFGIAPNQIFLPATDGHSRSSDGTLTTFYADWITGSYWSSTQEKILYCGTMMVYSLIFIKAMGEARVMNSGSPHWAFALPVRCVAE